jgi:hypothetical protein
MLLHPVRGESSDAPSGGMWRNIKMFLTARDADSVGFRGSRMGMGSI